MTRIVVELVKHNTENPPLDENAVQFYIRDELRKVGAQTTLRDPGSKATALISSLGKGSSEGLILWGHADVAPVGDKTSWTHPPFAGVIRDGTLFGRGAADMKGGLAAALYAYKSIHGLDLEPRRKVKFVSLLDGEYWQKTPVGWGTLDWLFETKQLDGDSCVFAEPSGGRRICIGETGELWLTLKCMSEPKHGSFAVYDENVCVKLFRAMEEICRAITKKVEPPNEIGSLFAKSCELLEKETRLDGKKKQLRRVARLLQYYMLNVGLVSGGIMINTVPDRCEASLCFCVPIGGRYAHVTKTIRETLRDPRFGNVILEPIDEPKIGPAYTSPSSKTVRDLSLAIRGVTGKDPHLIVAPSYTDANTFRHYGIDTAVYGPGSLDRIHGYNESVKIKNVLQAARVYTQLLLRYMFDPTA